MHENMLPGPEFNPSEMAGNLARQYLSRFELTEADLGIFSHGESPRDLQELQNYILEALELKSSLLNKATDELANWLPSPQDEVQIPQVIDERTALHFRQLLIQNPDFTLSQSDHILELGFDPEKMIEEVAAFNMAIFNESPPEGIDFETVKLQVPQVISPDTIKLFALQNPNRSGFLSFIMGELGLNEPHKNFIYSEDAEFSALLTADLLDTKPELTKYFLLSRLQELHIQLTLEATDFLEAIRLEKQQAITPALRAAKTQLQAHFMNLAEAELAKRGSEGFEFVFGFRDGKARAQHETDTAEPISEKVLSLEPAPLPSSSESYISTLHFSRKNGQVFVMVRDFQANWKMPPEGCYIRSQNGVLEYGQEENGEFEWSDTSYGGSFRVPTPVSMMIERMVVADLGNATFKRLNSLQQQSAVDQFSDRALRSRSLLQMAEFFTTNPLGQLSQTLYWMPPTHLKWETVSNAQ